MLEHTQGVIPQSILLTSTAATVVCAFIVFHVLKRSRQPSPRTNIVDADFQAGVARMRMRRVATTGIDPVRLTGTITFTVSDQGAVSWSAAVELMEDAILREVDARINNMSEMAAIVHADELRAGLLRALAETQRCGITVTGAELHLEGAGGEQSGNPPTRFIA